MADRSNLVSGLYHAALELPPDQRAAFLQDACNGNQSLRLEVESLLQHDADSARFLERPAAVMAADAIAAAGPSMTNRQVGPYRIVRPLGVGGMGEVYRATDTKLGRDVAIKILPAHFTEDPERRARFAREARLLATLNHPHIGAIYGLEEADGLTALVLELVEGPTLADRLERGPMKMRESLTIARQIGEALEAAHAKGIVHRDLKPSNIVLQTSPGSAGEPRAKVLDFGLAKTFAVAPSQDLTAPSSRSLEGTVEGRILGTPAYMSPEQARGQAVDQRTAIWAFGCVLFEMLTGRRAFEGETVTDTLVRILEREPEWAALPAETSLSIRVLLQRCVRKDPLRRLRDIGDVLIEIEDAVSPAVPAITRAAGSGDKRHRNLRPRLWTASAFAAGVLLAVAVVTFVRPQPPQIEREPLQLDVAAPPGRQLAQEGPGAHFALSPDGSRIVFVVRRANEPAVLWLRPLGARDGGHQLPGTEGALNPFWSPDSKQIAFFGTLAGEARERSYSSRRMAG
jgi:serine/threonine-protein kinase